VQAATRQTPFVSQPCIASQPAYPNLCAQPPTRTPVTGLRTRAPHLHRGRPRRSRAARLGPGPAHSRVPHVDARHHLVAVRAREAVAAAPISQKVVQLLHRDPVIGHGQARADPRRPATGAPWRSSAGLAHSRPAPRGTGRCVIGGVASAGSVGDARLGQVRSSARRAQFSQGCARLLSARRASRLVPDPRSAGGMDAAGLTLKLLLVGDSAVGKSRCWSCGAVREGRFRHRAEFSVCFPTASC